MSRDYDPSIQSVLIDIREQLQLINASLRALCIVRLVETSLSTHLPEEQSRKVCELLDTVTTLLNLNAEAP